ncbi:non-structural maintenance of chromosomes element 1 [Acrasis kona]|uniref:Non-structural maintenance of chromosomes element 1 homolog n=1 Tax=Acrasis kona TaxID=1008807 RepID=A0AAW2YZG9_9EUKA
MEHMTETHRHLLQFIMKEGYLSKKKLNDTLDNYKVQHEYKGRDRVDEDFTRTINNAIGPMHLAIKAMVHPRSKDIYFAIINEQDDEISKLATQYNAHEVQLFKQILNAIVENENSSITTTDAVNLRDNKSMNIEETEKVLNSFAKDGWIEKKKDEVWFGIRTLLELRMYLLNEFEVDTQDL